MIHQSIKRTAKKLFSHKYKGLFILLSIKQNSISFKNANNVVFSYQVGTEIENYFNLFKGCGIFNAGYVHTGSILTPTFKSEYSQLELVEVAEFKPFHTQTTDNPDYIKRTALQITLN